jgi:hypothetical protein
MFTEWTAAKTMRFMRGGPTNVAAGKSTFGMRLRRNGCSAKKHEPETSELNKCDGEPESDSVDVSEMRKSTRLHDVGPFDTSVSVLEEVRLHNRSERALSRLVHGRLRNLK